MPNGLLVNEIECEQTVKKYLSAEAKIGQNSITKNIKDRLSLDFILNSYKMTINKKLSEFSPIIDDTIQKSQHLDDFIQLCEHILEKTCSTLTNFKRIFNLNSHLNPGVSAILKSLLMSDEKRETVISSSNINGHFEKTINNLSNETDQLLDKRCTRSSKSKIKQIIDLNNVVNSTILDEQSISKKINTETTDIEELNDFVTPKKKAYKSSNNLCSALEEDNMVHPLDLFGDMNSDEDKNVRKLRSRKPINYNQGVCIINIITNIFVGQLFSVLSSNAC